LAAGGEQTVVFLLTYGSVAYHHTLFALMGSVLGEEDEEYGCDDNFDGDGKSEKSTSIFGRACLIYKLHGNDLNHKHVSILLAFSDNNQKQSAILLATNVAARGLNFPSLDWIVQYNPPCEIKDYFHRAGRLAQAGQAGHALLLLLPLERQYIKVLELRSLRDISLLPLSSTLSAAAALCKGLMRESKSRASMGRNAFPKGGAKAFTYAIQSQLEECIVSTIWG
jgi:ATP-dependent RNA helicase DDX31/DBP7